MSIQRLCNAKLYSHYKTNPANLNTRRNWHQKLQKRVVFFPKLKRNLVKRCGAIPANFTYGQVAMLPTNALLLSQLFMIRFDLKLKRVVRKKDKTLRRFWITTRVLFNLTRQSKGARMGKGKGKNLQLLQRINPFTNFIEFKGVRFGRLVHFNLLFNSLFNSYFFLVTRWSSLLNRTGVSTFRST